MEVRQLSQKQFDEWMANLERQNESLEIIAACMMDNSEFMPDKYRKAAKNNSNKLKSQFL